MSRSLLQYQRVYFLGAGGIGMSALARYFKACGMEVAGYDRTSTPLTDELRKEGIAIHFLDDINEIPADFKKLELKDSTLVVLTPAVPKDHAELNYFLQQGFTVMKRSEVLGLITTGVKTFAVAGTHGKTTTSSILAHILRYAGKNVTAFLGGIAVNYQSNYLEGNPANDDHCIVVEADEFDRSFLTLFPSMAVITSMDPDHLDIYGDASAMRKTYHQFASQVSDLLLLHFQLEDPVTDAKILHYGIDKKLPYHAQHIQVVDGRYQFDLVTPGYTLKGLTLGLPGRHNIENAVGASAIALENGVDPGTLAEALADYKGVQRRFEVCVHNQQVVYIDDYAHHPAELKAAILSAKELFPGKKITGIFQPHLFTRTRDFADGFAESLDLLDCVYLMDIYPARELPLTGITSATIMERMRSKVVEIVSPEVLIQKLRADKPEVLMTLGAGDIDKLVQPITRLLTTA